MHIRICMYNRVRFSRFSREPSIIPRFVLPPCQNRGKQGGIIDSLRNAVSSVVRTNVNKVCINLPFVLIYCAQTTGVRVFLRRRRICILKRSSLHPWQNFSLAICFPRGRKKRAEVQWGREKGGEGERRRGYPLHKLYLTAPAGARLLAHAFTCAVARIVRVAIQDATRSGVERSFHSTGQGRVYTDEMR